MDVPILASGGAGSGMTQAVSDVMGVVSTVMTTITGNAVLMAFFCAGIIGVAIAIVRKLKR